MGSFNFVLDFYEEFSKRLWKRSRKNPPPSTMAHTRAVQNIKNKVKYLPCLSFAHPSLKIVEIDASDIRYRGILKQIISNKNVIIRYHSGL